MIGFASELSAARIVSVADSYRICDLVKALISLRYILNGEFVLGPSNPERAEKLFKNRTEAGYDARGGLTAQCWSTGTTGERSAESA